MKRALLDELLRCRRDGRAVVLLTRIPSGEHRLVDPEAERPADLPGELWRAVTRAQRTDEAASVAHDGDDVFVRPFNPPLRMIVVGAVHIAQPLARMAAIGGFAVTVVDPRTAFANEARFPGVTRRTGWPDAELEGLAIDGRTAVVTLTHDPKLDDPALHAALRSDAFYVGALGSKKTHGARLRRLREAGFDDDTLSRIRGPVGLAIGARTPAEIATAILAEVIQVLRGAEPS